MRPRVKGYLYDAHEACLLLRKFTEGKSFDDYEDDDMLRSAVERQFGIIGEALGCASDEDPSLEAEITDFRKIVGFRNQLIHAYSGISNDVVWGIVEGKLGVLEKELKDLLETPVTDE